MKRKLVVAVPVLLLVGLAAWLLRPKREALPESYVSERSVTLWSSVAQVREAIDTLHYGDRVDVMARRNDNAKVRTAGGQIGWIDGRVLMEPALWQRSEKLLADAQRMPMQARGRTKVQTNLRAEPGRSARRLYQFGRGVPVEIVSRSVEAGFPVADEKEASDPPGAKKVDWFLVRGVAVRPPGDPAARNAEPASATPSGDSAIPIAGWVVARFVELDLPDPVREGINSANVRPIAWFELNRISDPAGDKPQYLVAGTHGPEGQPCDFTTLRVYTWDPRRTRYETAFIENNLCGQLPIRIGQGPKAEPEFRFHVRDADQQERVYRLIQTAVRRIREDQKPGSKPGSRVAAKRPAK